MKEKTLALAPIRQDLNYDIDDETEVSLHAVDVTHHYRILLSPKRPDLDPVDLARSDMDLVEALAESFELDRTIADDDGNWHMWRAYGADLVADLSASLGEAPSDGELSDNAIRKLVARWNEAYDGSNMQRVQRERVLGLVRDTTSTLVRDADLETDVESLEAVFDILLDLPGAFEAVRRAIDAKGARDPIGALRLAGAIDATKS